MNDNKAVPLHAGPSPRPRIHAAVPVELEELLSNSTDHHAAAQEVARQVNADHTAQAKKA